MKIDQDVFIQQGILDCQIDQLLDYSHTDPDVQKFTSDPVRFKDRPSFNNWLQQGKIIYTLIDKSNNLLGIIWFSQKNPPIKIDANFTFAIRIYGPARGQGLSLDFMKTAFTDLLQSNSNPKISGFWLETHHQNSAAIHLYQKFGFKIVSPVNNNLLMVWSPDKI